MPMPSDEIHFPDLGDFHDVLVIDVLVKVGDRVEVETPLVTLETDKATMDVPSPSAGVIGKLHVTQGSKVNSGELLATLDEGAAKPDASAQPGNDDASEKDAKPAASAQAKSKSGAGKVEARETGD